jgi:ATP-dependent HslUV protease ATP-binding subunit HslU
MSEALTPHQTVAELDKYIIGQADAKRSVAIALRNRWRRMQAPPEMMREIMPNNILMIGSTGVGKTEIARRLAQLVDAPFVKVEASKFTEVGYVGRDVESMVRDLVEHSVNLVRTRHMAEAEARAAQLAEDRLLDLLIPPVKSPRSDRSRSPDDSPSGFLRLAGLMNEDEPEAAKESESDSQREDRELNERTREKLREKLRNGELDHRKVEVEMTVPSHNVQVMAPAGLEGMEGLQEMLSNMVPKKKKQRELTIAEARDYFTQEEAERLIDMDAISREALEKAENNGIIFIDEIDKVASSSSQNRGGPDVSREGVQRDLLPIVEGATVSTKYGPIKTDHVLFIAAGAFHVAKPSDLIPELQGRFPIRVELQPLTQADFVRILQQPRNALTKQYQAMLEAEGVTLEFTPEAIESMATYAFEVNQEVENIGARRLHTILSNLLEDILFEVPDQSDTRHFTISADMVQHRLGRITGKKDLSRYIL